MESTAEADGDGSHLAATCQPPPWTPRRCTAESDFAMSAAGVDLTNFLKGWGRSWSTGKGWGSW